MIRTEDNGSTYKVIANAAMRQALLELQARAAERGLGPAVLAAMKTMQNWLRHDPLALGEPVYHLYQLKMQMRVAVIPPLHIHYAVHQTEPIVFIKGVDLLVGSSPSD
jgi:hypothetical protein